MPLTTGAPVKGWKSPPSMTLHPRVHITTAGAAQACLVTQASELQYWG